MNSFFKKFYTKKFSRAAQSGSGNIYVIAILGTIVAGSALMVGGLVPKLDPPASDAKVVQVDTDVDPSENNSALELRSFGVLPDTPIPAPPVCESAAIAILVDTSDSMAIKDGGVSRIDRLKSALTIFVSNFKPDTVVGLFRFSSDAKELVPFGTYQDQNQALQNAIAGLTNGGTTRMSLGFKLVQDKINEAKLQFPNRRFYTVFMTDGLPEDGDCKYEVTKDIYVKRDDTRCTVTINGKTVNATIANHIYNPTAIATQMQSSGIEIFSIPLYGDNFFTDFGEREVHKLFQRITTNPDSTYLIRVPSATNLTEAYGKIGQLICPTSPAPTP